MCGDAIEKGLETAGNFVVDNPITKTVINVAGTVIGAPVLGDLIARLHDFSHVDDSDYRKPPGDPSKLGEDMPAGMATAPMDILEDSFDGVSFQSVYDHMVSADRDVAPNFTTKWGEVADRLGQAVGRFENSLLSLETADDRWIGSTRDAAIGNVTSSLSEVRSASRGAEAMSVLVDVYSRTITTAIENIVDNYQNYVSDLNEFKEHQDEVRQNYATFAQNSMKSGFAPYISAVAKNNPAFTTGTAPQVGPPPSPTPTPGIGGPGTGGSGGPSPGGAGSPKPPDASGFLSQVGKASMPTAPTANPTPGGTPSMPELPTDALSGLGDAAGGLGDAAKDAANQAGDAAKQALDQAMNAAKGGPAGLPEGVLGLGPNGLNGAVKSGGGSGVRGAGGGGGGSGTGGLGSKPAGAATAAAGKSSTAPVTASRAGLSTSAGSPGAGAPAGGHRGGADGKEHKASKALRRRKNGENVVGDSEAVVAVLGSDGQESDNGKPASS